jgi:hypothetical protein
MNKGKIPLQLPNLGEKDWARHGPGPGPAPAQREVAKQLSCPSYTLKSTSEKLRYQAATIDLPCAMDPAAFSQMQDGFMSPAAAEALRGSPSAQARPNRRASTPPQSGRAAITARSGKDARRRPSFAPGGGEAGKGKEEASDAI